MRVFWILLSLAVVGGLVFVFAPAGGGGSPTVKPNPAAATPFKPQAAAEPNSKAAESAPLAAPAPVASSAGAGIAATPQIPNSTTTPTLITPTPVTPTPVTPTPAALTALTPKGSTQPTAPKPASPADDAATAKAAAADEQKQPDSASTPAAALSTAQSSAAPQAIPGITDGTNGDGMFAKAIEGAAAGEPVTLAEHPVFKGEKSQPSKAVRKADGSLLIDERFNVSGAGTATDPFVVPWDMIISAQETYKPRLGMTKIPQRVAMLDGKHVKIVGFIAFPITAASPKEALIMLNQWDGCCIGTPPSPYDAIEVKLAAPATGGQKTMASGTMTGIFKVDPYEDGGWLLGLYLMEDATLTAGEAL